MYKRESRRPKVPILRRLESEGLTVGPKHNQEAKFKNSKVVFQAVSVSYGRASSSRPANPKQQDHYYIHSSMQESKN